MICLEESSKILNVCRRETDFSDIVYYILLTFLVKNKQKNLCFMPVSFCLISTKLAENVMMS